MIPLSKTMDQGDYASLAAELRTVEQYFHREAMQDPIRRWEYSMALRALCEWGGAPRAIADVGGSGSPLRHMIAATGFPMSCIEIIDPKETLPLHDYVGNAEYSAVFCISTIEHIKEPMRFLGDLASIVSDGGLLFLTMDAWNQPKGTKDVAHFHWMREWMPSLQDWKEMYEKLTMRGFSLLGSADWDFYQCQMPGSYSIASLALKKG